MTIQEIKDAIKEKTALIATINGKLKDLGDIKNPEQSNDAIQEMQYRSAATALMDKDPDKALELINKADAIRQRAESSSKEMNPDQIRQQLRIARGNAMNVVSSTSDQVTKNMRDLAQDEALIYSNEMTKVNPSMQIASQKVDELYTNRLTNNADGINPPPTQPAIDSIPSTIIDQLSGNKIINAKLSAITYKGPKLDKVVSDLNELINASGASGADKTILLKKVADNAKDKSNAPGTTTEDKESYRALIDGLNKGGSLGAVGAAMDLANTMQDAINRAAPNGKLTNNETRKLAAIAYRTYQPGVMQGVESINADNAALAASTPEASIRQFAIEHGFNIQNELPYDKAVALYNSALENGKNAWPIVKNAIDSRKKLFNKTPLTDAYFSGFFDPATRMVGAKAKPQVDVSKLAVWNKDIANKPGQTVFKIDQQVRLGNTAYTVVQKPDGSLGLK